jgi:putative MATE family efflux protein
MRLLLRFSLPMLVGNIFQQFYSMVDAMIVGRFVGVDALAAVGATGGMSFLVLGFVIGLANGFCVVVSQRFGARDEAGLRRCVAMTMLLSLIVTAVATAASFLGTEPMLRAMNTPENIFSDSAAYIGIIFLGLGASLFYNLFSGLLRAVGDSKTPLYFLCLSSALNVVLDLLFVVTFSMGVAGAAWATILSQGVSALLCLVYIRKKLPFLRIQRDDMRMNGTLVRQTTSYAAVAALQQSSLYLGKLMIQSAVNGLGTAAISAFTATTRVENFSQAFGISGCESIAIFVAQNQGAKKYRRALSGFLRGSVMVVGIGFLFSLLLFFGGGQLVLPFLDGEAESAALGASYLRLMGCFYFLSFMGHSYVGHYRGIGRMNITFWGTTLQIAVRVVLTYALAGAMGLDAVALATGLGWVAIVLFHSTVFLLELKGIGFRLPTRDEDSQPG